MYSSDAKLDKWGPI